MLQLQRLGEEVQLFKLGDVIDRMSHGQAGMVTGSRGHTFEIHFGPHQHILELTEVVSSKETCKE